jgi:hypothetical protein
MLGKRFRPWGQISWIFDKFPRQRWSILGSLSTEPRCLSVWEWFARRPNEIAHSVLLEIHDPPSRFTALATNLRTQRRSELQNLGLPSGGVSQSELFALDQDIVAQIDGFLSLASPNILLDITCLPKRFFFPFIHRIMQSQSVRNFLVTYTSPGEYYSGALAEDHKTLAPLPLFRIRNVGGPRVELVIIGIGYMPLGLPDFLDKYKFQVDVETLLPIPKSAEAFQRNWKFINSLRRDYPEAVRNPTRVDGADVPDIFDYIRAKTNQGRTSCEFGPFGPKTMSLAMCLFARLAGSVVRYTQPTIYHPHYTTGIHMTDGEASINTYSIRLDGVDLYDLKSP